MYLLKLKNYILYLSKSRTTNFFFCQITRRFLSFLPLVPVVRTAAALQRTSVNKCCLDWSFNLRNYLTKTSAKVAILLLCLRLSTRLIENQLTWRQLISASFDWPLHRPIFVRKMDTKHPFFNIFSWKRLKSLTVWQSSPVSREHSCQKR